MDLTPEQLELSVLSALRTPDAVREAVSLGIGERSFQVWQHAEAFRYLEGRASRDEAATARDVEAATGVALLEEATDVRTFADELIRAASARLARAAMQASISTLERDPTGTIASLVDQLNGITARADLQHSSGFDDDERRFAEVVDRATRVGRGEVVGIMTGLPVWDERGHTFKPGDLVAVIAATNGGKSWMLVHFGVSAWMQGKRVLFLSPESTKADIHNRVDVVLARRRYGIAMSNEAIRNGTMTPGQLEDYKKYYGLLLSEGRSDWVTRDSGDKGVFSVDDVVSHARQFRPDLVLLDGFHLLRTPGGKSWETIKSAAETIKGLSQDLGITVIAASQARRDAVIARDDTPELGDTAYGMALVEAANRVIALAEKRGDKKMRVFTVPKHRDGEVITTKQFLKFDVDSGDIAQYKPAIDGDGMVNFL